MPTLTPDSLSHVMLYVREVAPAIAWYREHFGFEVVYDSPYYGAVRHPGIGCVIGLHPIEADSPEIGHGAQVYFGVKDIEGAVAALRGAGIEVQDPKSEGGSKRFAGFRDLDGNKFVAFHMGK